MYTTYRNGTSVIIVLHDDEHDHPYKHYIKQPVSGNMHTPIHRFILYL